MSRVAAALQRAQEEQIGLSLPGSPSYAEIEMLVPLQDVHEVSWPSEQADPVPAASPSDSTAAPNAGETPPEAPSSPIDARRGDPDVRWCGDPAGRCAQVPTSRLSWQEAVAIVQEVASRLAPGVAVPAPDQLVLDSNGHTGPRLRRSQQSPVDRVRRLAILLEWLLDGTCPPPVLTRIAAENAGDRPVYATVELLSKTLAQFEQPNRRQVLLAIAGRIYPTEAEHAPVMERVRHKVATLLRWR